MKNTLTTWTAVAGIACIAVLTACSPEAPSAEAAPPQKSVRETKATGDLPTPRRKVSFETKYTEIIPLEGKEPAYEIVDQWVFRPDDEKDGTLICVDDDQHCIGLLKLKEQLGRPSNDPLGIR